MGAPAGNNPDASHRVAPTTSEAGGRSEPDPLLQSLGPTDAARHVAYRNLLQEALPEHVIAEIRAYLQQQRALGRDAFRAMIEAKTLRFAATRPAHRPPQSRQPPSQAGK